MAKIVLRRAQLGSACTGWRRSRDIGYSLTRLARLRAKTWGMGGETCKMVRLERGGRVEKMPSVWLLELQLIEAHQFGHLLHEASKLA